MANYANKGMEVAMNSIFILGIGLGVAVGVIETTNLTGISATILGFVPVIIVAGYIAVSWKSLA